MASLFKRPGSPYWFIAFDVTQADGSTRRFKKSTKRRKRDDAVKEGIRLEELEVKKVHGKGDIAATAYSALSEAADAAARGELSEARARQIIAKMAEASTGERLVFYTVRSWAEDWLASKAAGSKDATSKRYSTSIRAFLTHLGEKADSKLEAVTKADVRSFRDAIRKGWKGKPRSASTTNFYAADVASMFRAAVRENLLLASPAAALEKLPEDDSTEREVFTVAEVGKLVAAAGHQEWQDKVYAKTRNAEKAEKMSAEWQGLILAGFYTGARLGDCARMTWANVDLSAGIITFMPAKTSRKKKRLQVPIHPRLKSYLLKISETGKAGPLFPLLHTRSVAGKTGLSGHFGAIAQAAEVDRRTVREAVRDKKGKVTQRSIQARTFHSLWHSLTSQLANADVPEEIRRRIVGHESSSVHQGYTHTENATLARAVALLPDV